MSRPDVIIVGAGFAGLSAAVRLAGGGAQVLVVEERRRLGGRATSFPDAETGELVDNGQHVIFGCYHETFDFLRAVGASDDVRIDERLDVEIVDREGTRSRLRASVLPPPFHLVGGLLQWPALGFADRLAAIRLGASLGRVVARGTGSRALDGVTVDQWLVERGQTARLREVLWEPLAVAALNQSTAVASAGPFVEVLARMFGGTRRDAAIGLPVKPLDQWFAEPACAWLESAGHAVRRGAPARVLVEGESAVGVEIRGERVLAGAVVSAVPWFSFASLAAGVPALSSIADAASRMAASPIVTVNLWFDRSVTDVPFVGLPGRTFQWVFDKGRLCGERWSHVSLVSSGADAVVGLSNQELVELAQLELAEALPATRHAELRRATAVREKRATFSLAPGQPPRPGPETPVRGLHLAGDWTDTGLPATIESAVVSGHRAAQRVLRSA